MSLIFFFAGVIHLSSVSYNIAIVFMVYGFELISELLTRLRPFVN